MGSTDVDQARRQVDTSVEAGGNLIDTADVYSGGLAEDLVGEVLKAAATQCCWLPRSGCRPS